MEEIIQKIDNLSKKIMPINRNISNRLRSVIEMITKNQISQLAAVDLKTILDPVSIEEKAFINFRSQNFIINFIEWIRNVLVLVPITYTWLELSIATSNYRRYIDLFPEKINQPFLLLWENGFQGLTPQTGATFSELAKFDFVLLTIIIIITLIVHFQKDVKEGNAINKAQALRTQTEEVLWELEQVLGTERAKQISSRSTYQVKKSVDEFSEQMQEYLNLIAFELDRLEKLDSKKQRESDSLREFTEALRESTKELLKYNQDYQEAYNRLHQPLAGLVDQIEKSGNQQETILNSLKFLGENSQKEIDAFLSFDKQLSKFLIDINQKDRSNGNEQKMLRAIDNMGAIADQVVQSNKNIRSALSAIETNDQRMNSMMNKLSKTVEDIAALKLNQTTGSSQSNNRNYVLWGMITLNSFVTFVLLVSVILQFIK